MKKKLKKEKLNFFRRNSKFLIMIIVITSLLGIGYAQVTANDLSITGIATAFALEDLEITDVDYSTSTHADTINSRILSYNHTLLTSRIVLDNNSDAEITYEVTITNASPYEQIYNGSIYHENFYDNSEITFELNGISPGDSLASGDSITFTITFKYAEVKQSYNNTVLNSCIYFKFDEQPIPAGVVAKLGSTFYSTIQEAVNNAGSTDTILIVNDTTESVSTPAGKNLTINLNNHTITNDGNNFIFENRGGLIIGNGTLSTSNADHAAINNQDNGICEVSDITITVSGGRQAIYNNGGTVTVHDGTNIHSTSTIRAPLTNNAGTMYILGGNIVAENHSAVITKGALIVGDDDGDVSPNNPCIQAYEYGIKLENNGTNEYYDGVLKSLHRENPLYDSNTTTYAANTTPISSTEKIDGSPYHTYYLGTAQTMIQVIYNPGEGTVSPSSKTIAIGMPIGYYPTPTLTGHVFDGWFTEPTNGVRVDESYTPNANKTLYAYWVDVSKIAEINGQKFTSLQAAIDSITNSTPTTILLKQNTAETLTIASTKNITINLDGHTISNPSSGVKVFDNSGTLTLRNGYVKTTATQGAINNSSTGTITIDGVDVSSLGDRQAVFNTGGRIIITGGSTLTSKAGGTQSGQPIERGTIQNQTGGIVELISGTVINTRQQAISNQGTVIIGTDDSSVNASDPVIRGQTYGIKELGTTTMYDGIIMGYTDPINTQLYDWDHNFQQTTGTATIESTTYNTLYLQ